ncbi:Conserved_hypothetical protein [Hexamita inflata]|uniref:RING-type domain-containing protein n=1 Tax=Hexamita inflata TaxID=28002 RepID=A0AA86QNY7_9EUKA|nr:Conserved hypothetical protein [Hexamita inflata]
MEVVPSFINENTPIIFEELTQLQLNINQSSCFAVSQYEKTNYVIIGTKNGKVFITELKSLNARVLQVSNNPILHISVDPDGLAPEFIVSDGFQYVQVDYNSTSVVNLNLPPNIYNVHLYYNTQQNISQLLTVTSSSISTYKQKKLFKTTKDSTDIQIETPSQNTWLTTKFLIIFEKNLTFINRESKKQCNVQQIDRDFVVTDEQVQFIAPCTCCKPQIHQEHSNILVSWHTHLFVLNFSSKTASKQQIENRIIELRTKFEFLDDKLVLVGAFQFSKKVISASIFMNYFAVLFEDELVFTNGSGKTVLQIQLPCKPISMEAEYLHKINSYVYKSTTRYMSESLLILLEDRLTIAYPLAEIEALIILNNKFNLLCENADKNTADILQMNVQIQNTVQKIFEKTKEKGIFKILENILQTLLQLNFVDEAVNLLRLLIKLNSDEDKYLNNFLPLFAAKGVLNSLMPLLPDPREPNALQKEIYLQLIDTLLLNDYQLLSHVLKQWRIYDVQQMTYKVKQLLSIAKRTFQEEKLNPKYLRLSMLFLYQTQERYDLCFEYLSEFYSEEDIIDYCENYNLNTQLLQSLEKFNFSFEKKIEILIKLIQQENHSEAVIIKVFQSITNQKHTKLDTIIQSYAQQKYITLELKNLDNTLKICFNILTYLLSIDIPDAVLLHICSLRNLIVKFNPDIHIYVKLVNKLLDAQNKQLEQFRDAEQYYYFFHFTSIHFDCFINQYQKINNSKNDRYLFEPEINKLIFININPKQQSLFKCLLEVIQFIKTNTQPEFNYLTQICLQVSTDYLNNSIQVNPVAHILNLFQQTKLTINSQQVQSVLKPIYINTQVATQTIQALNSQLRQLLPLEELLQTGVGIQMLQSLKQEVIMQQSILEVLAESMQSDYKRRENELNKGVMINICEVCNKTISDGTGFMCGHCYHEQCLKDVLNSIHIEINTCPRCLNRKQIDEIYRVGVKWHQVLGE